jgi:hypothetical protein
MQSDRPLAAYRSGLYANSFLRDDQERNHTRLWEVDLGGSLRRWLRRNSSHVSLRIAEAPILRPYA